MTETVLEKFERLVRAQPDRLAVVDGSTKLRYVDLDRAADGVASALLAGFARAGDPVAICTADRRVAITAMLGVLKTGAPFLVLDPAWPAARLEYLVQDSMARVALVGAGEAAALDPVSSLEVLDVDALSSQSEPPDPGARPGPDDPMWLMYTSGSTGQPKGVVQTHRNTAHSAHTYQQGLGMHCHDRAGMVLAPWVNLGAQLVFTALWSGASLHIADVLRDGPAGVVRILREANASMLWAAPTTLRMLTSALDPAERITCVRTVLVAGEQTSTRDLEAARAAFGAEVVFVNRYGTTETDIIAWERLEGAAAYPPGPLPIGRPVAGKTVLVVDDGGGESKPGEVGEIAVRSHYLSPGYWKRPDLSAAAYQSGAQPADERTYLTGDLGRFATDGRLWHCGRKDRQIKVRGHRIEPTEIEVALCCHSGVAEAAVVLHPDGGRMVAYWVCASSRPPSSDLRAHLVARLPMSMVPATFVELERLPVLANGKIDRRALPDPSNRRPDAATPFVAPSSPLEHLVADIWSEVLGIEAVGLDDDFLELGGDSLRAALVITRLLEATRVEVPLDSLFVTPTVSGLVELIVEHRLAELSDEKLAALLDEVESRPGRAGRDPAGVSS